LAFLYFVETHGSASLRYNVIKVKQVFIYALGFRLKDALPCVCYVKSQYVVENISKRHPFLQFMKYDKILILSL